ncbi:hypothetical protein LTR35_014390 [Friedmanniomyces endolithicus]|uniref:3-phytase n=1 Tax=Friedmanniomyces endolithicus TaxID=329885 RepID=A0AAN6G2T7_9PEZI|nr:hypothetical protein LTR35_014390 [Friedmanniomyces endolithicus]KAK0294389.1 hypothetical protein LTS00_006979 [Friedmanniomyces endolithicus]KAK0326755.1 hypothetical protein LTR82_002598 [Friedmanniomyces endolithicus]KAK1013403.1 hypothetical protein LTR54_004310 [Friedmanniomyces endolithicus]
MHATALALFAAGALAQFDPLHHLGGNSPYFSGPNVFGISPDAPEGCTVDQAGFTSRHGSRYPDPSAYYSWTNLSAKIHAQSFTTNASEFAFLHTWQPVLRNPAAELSALSPGGWKELYDMGVFYRWLYPSFYTENTPFNLWANRYQETVFRVVDSARLFARGYLGPPAEVEGSVYVLNNTDPRSIANSLAPSDLCANYNDDSGGINATTWANIYVPPIVDRINGLFHGLQFNSNDVTQFPVLCGFETQITGRRSPWCDTFTPNEILQYEYSQDIRYWYGTGLGTQLEKNLMLPFLTALVQRFIDGPTATYNNTNSTGPAFHPNPLIATFTNDGQISQLSAAIGVFDAQPQLPATYIPANRTYKSSNFVPMRGTIGFERLNCGYKGLFMRIKLDDQVYPVPACQQGPGRSCPLEAYRGIVAGKSAAAGDYEVECGIANSSVVPVGRDYTTFLTDLDLPWEYVVKP